MPAKQFRVSVYQGSRRMAKPRPLNSEPPRKDRPAKAAPEVFDGRRGRDVSAYLEDAASEDDTVQRSGGIEDLWRKKLRNRRAANADVTAVPGIRARHPFSFRRYGRISPDIVPVCLCQSASIALTPEPLRGYKPCWPST